MLHLIEKENRMSHDVIILALSFLWEKRGIGCCKDTGLE